MKARVVKNFHDLKEDIDRKAGDVFECEIARFREIDSKLPGYVEEASDAVASPEPMDEQVEAAKPAEEDAVPAKPVKRTRAKKGK